MERLTYSLHPGYTLTEEMQKEYIENKIKKLTDKVGKYEDLEEQIGCPLDVLIAICDTAQNIEIDENKVGEDYQKEKWKKVKSFIPHCFNRVYIFCDVWYEENFKGGSEELVIPIKQYKKTWWLKADRSE